jgi:hypothetical protein
MVSTTLVSASGRDESRNPTLTECLDVYLSQSEASGLKPDFSLRVTMGLKPRSFGAAIRVSGERDVRHERMISI